jgi:penicillin-binding protein 1A
MSQLLQEVTRSGTAARAQSMLKRPDLYGKTGTTNDAMDAWFAGYQPTLAAVTWIGYDTPRKLGDRETGGGLSLPVWISYMQQALQGVSVSEPAAPPGLVHEGNDWYYKEFPRGGGVTSLGTGAGAQGGSSDLPAADEKRKILDLFKN